MKPKTETFSGTFGAFHVGLICVHSIVLDIAHRWELVKKQHRPPSTLGLFAYDGNALGGALVGLGMATTGACPGTAMVQLAAAMTNGALVVLGGILGAAVFLKLKPVSEARRAQDSTAASAVATDSPADRQTAPAVAVAAKSCDIPTALSIQPLTMLLLWIPMCIGIILAAQAIDRPYGHFAGPVSPQFGGLLIGTAQAATVLLTHHHIGTSAAYEDVARWVAHKWSSSPSQGTQAPKITTPSLAFAAGIVCSSAILSRLLATHLPTTEPFTPSLPLIARTLVGGASMVFGARLAGGKQSTRLLVRTPANMFRRLHFRPRHQRPSQILHGELGDNLRHFWRRHHFSADAGHMTRFRLLSCYDLL